MSRKGNDLVRRLRYTAAQSAVKWNPPVKALFARLRADNKEYNVCLGHCMAKLLRQVFALWTQDCDFAPRTRVRLGCFIGHPFGVEAWLARRPAGRGCGGFAD